MIAGAAILMTVAYPGAYFPSISSRAAGGHHGGGRGGRKINSQGSDIQLNNVSPVP